MAKNDMRIIMYKILKYMYECLNLGKMIDPEDICNNCEMFRIPQTYWTQIMKELIGHKYVSGVYEIKRIGTGESGIKFGVNAGITFEGVQFLEENSGMEKVADFLGAPFETILLNIISRIM
jgi:hypothetical protein